jgi:hypothetical protein
MKRSYFITAPTVIAVICLGICTSGDINTFLDAAGIFMIILLPLLMAMATYSPAEIVECFAVAFRKEGADLAMIEKGIHFFSLLRSYLTVTALLTFMIGLILIMSVAEDLSQIGPKFAIGIVCIFYALELILLVTIPFKAGLEKKKIEMSR